MASRHDVVILGSSGRLCRGDPLRALRLKIAIVERELLGGICLNWGCILTKALLRFAEVFRTMKHTASYGFAPTIPAPTLPR